MSHSPRPIEASDAGSHVKSAQRLFSDGTLKDFRRKHAKLWSLATTSLTNTSTIITIELKKMRTYDYKFSAFPFCFCFEQIMCLSKQCP
jgi:hypothetical protein